MTDSSADRPLRAGDSIYVVCNPPNGHAVHGAAWRLWPKGKTGPLKIVAGNAAEDTGDQRTVSVRQVEELLRVQENPLRGLSVVPVGAGVPDAVEMSAKTDLYRSEQKVRDFEAQMGQVQVELRRVSAALEAAEKRAAELEALNTEFVEENSRLTKAVAELQAKASAVPAQQQLVPVDDGTAKKNTKGK